MNFVEHVCTPPGVISTKGNKAAPVPSGGLFQVMMVVAAMGMHFAGNMNKFGNAGKTFSYVVS